jgi:hypothetical protein
MTNFFLDIFGKLEDPRREHRKLHPMTKILFVTLCSCVAEPKSWIDVETFGHAKLSFLKKYLPSKMGFLAMIRFGDFFVRLPQNNFRTYSLNGFEFG